MMGGGVGCVHERHITFDERKKNALDLTMAGGGGGWSWVGGWMGWGGGLCNQVVILEKTKLYLKKKKDT